MAKTRVSSTVLLTRQGADGIEVYLVDRSPKLRFFGGYMALPGGVIEIADGTNEDEFLNDCAHRELFEETGVVVPELAARLGDRREAIRRALLDEDLSSWKEIFAAAGSPQLREFCRLTTPPFAPVRYATTFFHMDLPSGEKPEIWPGELTGGRYWKPAEALREWRAGSQLIVPPVLFLLELLERESSLEGFFDAAERETRILAEGRLHPVRFTPGVFMAALEAKTKPPATTTNAFLVGEDRIYVIDPASPEAAEQQRLFERMDARVASGAEIAGVLLTHYHPDHVGGVEATCKQYGVPMLAHSETFDRLPDYGIERVPVGDGEKIELGVAPDGTDGWVLEAIETPGHAPGHLSFVESRYRAAIVGDMLSTLSTVVIDPEEGHMVTYLQSLEKLKRAGIGTIYPGHGPAFRDGTALIERAISHRKKREDKIVATLGAEPRSIDELVLDVYDDVDARIHHLARKSLAAGLIKLAEEERAIETDGGWRIS